MRDSYTENQSRDLADETSGFRSPQWIQPPVSITSLLTRPK